MADLENFEIVTYNIRVESRKAGYNPETGTNWCHMPMEMRAECMKHMGFKTRVNLRFTSKMEKALVESRKLHFDLVDITFDCTTTRNEMLWVRTEGNGDCSMSLTSRFPDDDRILNHLKAVLDIGKIDNFVCWAKMRRADMMKMFFERIVSNRPPIKVRTLQFHYDFASTLREFLTFFEDAEIVSLNCTKLTRTKWFCLEKVGRFPMVANARLLCIVSNTKQQTVHKLITKWITNDAEVEKKFHFARVEKNTENAELFEKEFDSRLVRKSGLKYRIQTNNDLKHILVVFKRQMYQDLLVEVAGGVIPASFPEENENEWLDKIKAY